MALSSEPFLTQSLDRACALRESILNFGTSEPEKITNTCRLVDGNADAWPGKCLDLFGQALLFSTADQDDPAPFFSAIQAKFPLHSLYFKPLRNDIKAPPIPIAGPKLEGMFEVRENGLCFGIDFASGYSQGLFLDQRENRARVAAASTQGSGRLLNTFAYTCGFSVSAAAAGVETTSVDLSKACLKWGERNFLANGLKLEPHRFLAGDVFDWLKRLQKRGELFSGVVLDPPTFSRDRNSKTFRVERDYARLTASAAPLVEDSGFLLACSNCHKLHPARFKEMLLEGLERTGPWKIRSLPPAPDFPGSPHLKVLWASRT